MLGPARLEAYLQRSGTLSTADLIQGILTTVQEFVAGAPQSDDITAMAVRYLGRAP